MLDRFGEERNPGGYYTGKAQFSLKGATITKTYNQLLKEKVVGGEGKQVNDLEKATDAIHLTMNDLANIMRSSNALAQSLIDGLRDDDKDKKYSERFWSAFHGQEGDEESDWERALSFVLNGNLGQGLNPANRIPYVKDVMSIGLCSVARCFRKHQERLRRQR